MGRVVRLWCWFGVAVVILGFVGLIVIVWLTDLFRFPLSLLLDLF